MTFKYQYNIQNITMQSASQLLVHAVGVSFTQQSADQGFILGQQTAALLHDNPI